MQNQPKQFKKTLIKLFSLGILSTTFAIAPFAFAEKPVAANNAENIDVTQQQVTKDELAAIYVLSEVCPKLTKQDDQFRLGYSNLLKDYMPNDKTPEASLKKLMKQSSYAQALKQAELDAKNAGDKGNTEVCEDVKNYQS